MLKNVYDTRNMPNNVNHPITTTNSQQYNPHNNMINYNYLQSTTNNPINNACLNGSNSTNN